MDEGSMPPAFSPLSLSQSPLVSSPITQPSPFDSLPSIFLISATLLSIPPQRSTKANWTRCRDVIFLAPRNPPSSTPFPNCPSFEFVRPSFLNLFPIPLCVTFPPETTLEHYSYYNATLHRRPRSLR
ncbi:hypothetical protein FA13DRAFT_1740261, partial [Coprinellus micaceus]